MTPPHADTKSVSLASTDTETASAPAELLGIGVSAGVAVGRALLYRPETSDLTGTAAITETAAPLDAARELARLQSALATATAELRALAEQVAPEIGEAAGIFEAQAMMLEDPTIAERARALMTTEGMDAAAALSVAAEEQAAELAALPDPLWQARAADVRDAALRALRHLRPELVGGKTLEQRLATVEAPVILVADDLAPSEAAQVRTEVVRGFALGRGSATAHAAILARARGMPAVVGLGPALYDAVRDGDALVMDGTAGVLRVRPAEEEYTRAERAAAERATHARQELARLAPWRSRAGQTRDGVPVRVLANVGTEDDARLAAEMGAEGIGLLRTEFLFSEREALPDEREQAALYAAIIKTLGPARGPVIIRTLDAGADKPLPLPSAVAAGLPAEANPMLGVRGIRLHLAAPELLAAQLRAIVMAGAVTGASVRIMLPMVATVEEVRAARVALVEARARLAEAGVRLESAVPLGIMVETPAAVLSVASLAREAAFFSIGTNDLTQYVMAADRLNPRLAALCRPEQPAVLRAVAAVARTAHEMGRHMGVCGEMAGDPHLAPLLVGLGVDELSMNPASIPAVREALAAQTSGALRALAERALGAATVEEVDALVRESL